MFTYKRFRFHIIRARCTLYTVYTYITAVWVRYILKDNFEAINWENVSNGEPSFNTDSSVKSPRSTILSRNDGPILSAIFDSKFS